ncbi:hypothetical protein BDR26DRAFT_797845 [Obelidium mucronatum]|nr:hypothetical protein BDR26DRAFT_797845 [Obelidium mucronatum]
MEEVFFGLGSSQRDDFDFDFEKELQENEEAVSSASILEPIPATNMGFQMMLRMGWQQGSGLGREGRKGRVDPVPFVHKADKEGVGKSEEVEEKHVESTRTRKALESEVIAAESDEQRAKREIAVSEIIRVKEEIKAVTRPFYCELCDKQYTKISEFDMHLSSYDHNHKQVYFLFVWYYSPVLLRFKDMQEMSKRGGLPGVASSKRAREDKEKAREEREFKRLQEAAISKQLKASAPTPVTVAEPTPPSEKAFTGSNITAPTPITVSKPETKVAFGFGVKKANQPIKFAFGKK